MTTDGRDRIKTLGRESRELLQVNEILRKAGAFLPQWRSAAGSSHEGAHREKSRDLFRVDPPCKVPPIARRR